MKVFDVFLFGYELDLLEIRLNILDPYVDYFVFSESKWAFSGMEKGLYYRDNKERFKKFEHKIIYNEIPDPTENQLEEISKKYNIAGHPTYQRDVYQKDSIRGVLEKHCSDDDIIIQSDLDEIILPEALADIQGWFADPRAIYTGHQKFFMCHVNRLMYENGEPVEKWRGPQFCTLAYMKAFGGFNTCRNPGKGPDHVKEYLIDGCGWHFSFLGGNDKIKEKLQGYGHQEHNNDMVKDNLEENIKNNKDILGRGYYDYKIVPFDPEEYPRELVLNQEFYEEFIYADN